MKPIVLKGHTRPLTQVVYNREGDLLFSSSNDALASVWYTDNGERLGTYGGTDAVKGHKGAIRSLDVDFLSRRMITAGADGFVKVWDVETGKELYNNEIGGVNRYVKFGIGDDRFLLCDKNQSVSVVSLKRWEQEGTMEVESNFDVGNVSKAVFTALNEQVIVVTEDGFVKSFEVETGDLLNKVEAHNGPIKDLQLSKDGTTFITASVDATAKLYDSETLAHLKTYKSDRPINTAHISPLMDHVVLAGGQEASKVTTTAGRQGRFESVLYHKIYENEIGSIKGHFGPVNTVQFNPDGRSFATGGEDGYIRIVHFDPEYFLLANDDQ